MRTKGKEYTTKIVQGLFFGPSVKKWLFKKNDNYEKVKLNEIMKYYHDLYAANELKELLPELFNAYSK